MEPRPLPESARLLCERLAAPPRLIAHLTVVLDVAIDLVNAVGERFPALVFDRDAVLFGAATHDLGKVLHPGELTGAGNLHEVDGQALLESHGVSPSLARFALTHGAWRSQNDLPVEDLLVALADTIWKGSREPELEGRLAARIARDSGAEHWQVYATLGDIADAIAARAEERLALAF